MEVLYLVWGFIVSGAAKLQATKTTTTDYDDYRMSQSPYVKFCSAICGLSLFVAFIGAFVIDGWYGFANLGCLFLGAIVSRFLPSVIQNFILFTSPLTIFLLLGVMFDFI